MRRCNTLPQRRSWLAPGRQGNNSVPGNCSAPASRAWGTWKSWPRLVRCLPPRICFPADSIVRVRFSRTARVLPPASRAARWAVVSMPRAKPLMIVRPLRASSSPNVPGGLLAILAVLPRPHNGHTALIASLKASLDIEKRGRCGGPAQQGWIFLIIQANEGNPGFVHLLEFLLNDIIRSAPGHHHLGDFHARPERLPPSFRAGIEYGGWRFEGDDEALKRRRRHPGINRSRSQSL